MGEQMSVLKRKRLYKDTNGQVWHIKSDGKAVKYPQFEELQEVPKGIYKEILYMSVVSMEIADDLFLVKATTSHGLCFPSDLCVVDNDTANRNKNVVYWFSVVKCCWTDLLSIEHDYRLFPVVNLKKGAKYIVKKKEMTFLRYQKENNIFVFCHHPITGTSILCMDIHINQINDIKEVSNMSKEYKVWKTENGELYGRDCETGRTFVVTQETFERVEYFAKRPRVGDIVYINNLTGVKPYETGFVRAFAKRLNDDLLMLKYAYGYYPNFDTRDQSKRLWKVLYVGISSSIIEEHSAGSRAMICVCDNDSLTVSENQEDDEPF